MNPLVKISLIATTALATIFLMADCIGGSSSNHLGKIINKVYVPARTNVSCNDDGCTTDYDPPKYLSIVEADGRIVECDQRKYWGVPVGSHVIVKWRTGRWTKSCWMPHIVKVGDDGLLTASTEKPW